MLPSQSWDVDEISCGPYNIEENINLKEVKKIISIDKQEKMVNSEAVDCASQKSSTRSSNKMDTNLLNKNSVNDKGDKDTSWMYSGVGRCPKVNERTQLLSSEEADELVKAVVFCKKDSEIYITDTDIWRKGDPNVEISTLDKGIWRICLICKFESNSVEERIEHLKSERHEASLVSYLQSKKEDSNICPLCGFYSESIQERIEHLKGSRHTGAQDVKKAIICGFLENYATNTFYCTMCSWFVTDIHPLIEHMSSSRHNIAVLLSQYTKYEIIKTDIKGNVYCTYCKCILNSGSDCHKIYDHLMNHTEKCYPFYSSESWCRAHYCKSSHKCGICGDEHPKKTCFLCYAKKSSVITVHGNERILSGSSNTPMEDNAIVAIETENSNKNICRENSHDSSLPCTYSEIENEYTSKRLSSPLNNINEHYESEYTSKSHKEISKTDLKNVKDRILYSPENDKNKSESQQRRDRSRSPPRRHGSRSPYESSISNLKSPIERDPIKRHDSYSPLKQHPFTGRKQRRITNSSISFSDLDSDDEDEEFNIITSIVKLLRICGLLGNLGYFFAVTLNKALEIKESTDDVLAILREPANIILMEVILKKLKTFEKSVYDMRVSKKFIKGIMYLAYLIDVSKSFQSCNSSQNSSFMLNSSSLPSVRSYTNKVIDSHSSIASAEALALSWPSVSSKNLKLCHGLNVEEIAKTTVGRNIEYTIHFIKSSLKFIGRTPTRDAIGDIAVAVSNEHFRILSDT